MASWSEHLLLNILNTTCGKLLYRTSETSEKTHVINSEPEVPLLIFYVYKYKQSSPLGKALFSINVDISLDKCDGYAIASRCIYST